MRKYISYLLCVLLVFSMTLTCFASERTFEAEEKKAEDLKALGLFLGVSEEDFDLDRAPTRVEALVMLIRLLGEEKDALSLTSSHPFEDVPGWAEKYVGYGYQKGYTKGISEKSFGSEHRANEQMYLTFVLRALGYSDTNGDFTWDNPYDLAETAGITEKVEGEFLRADVAVVSHKALSSKTEKGNGAPLFEKLIEKEAFTREKYNEVMGISEEEKKDDAADEKDDPYSFIKPEGELFVDDLNLSIGTKSQKAMKVLRRFIETNADFYEWPHEYLVYRNEDEMGEIHYRLSHDRETGNVHVCLERFPEEGGSYFARIVLEGNGNTLISCDYYESRRATKPIKTASMYIDREDIYRGMGISLENFGGRPDEEREYEQKMQELIPEVAEFLDAVMQKNFKFYGCGSIEALGFDM